MNHMHLYKTLTGAILRYHQEAFIFHENWDQLINRDRLFHYLDALSLQSGSISPETADKILQENLLAPVGSQELWAAGVTYLRSRDARMEESGKAGGSDFYQRVYEAPRPELFFKANPRRISGHGGELYIRRDSAWNVPEPELTLYINASGAIQAYCIGNDMSSRSIEGENPLYLPQAKTYEKCAGLGPCLYIPEGPLDPNTQISISITRSGKKVFSGEIGINRMKRPFEELASYLFRECSFPEGCFLMTGTGIVPPDNFTLQKGDLVDISISGIGLLTNTIAENPHAARASSIPL
jgi:2-dehydro-3-deoxy-D-arabinonate dehydratase